MQIPRNLEMSCKIPNSNYVIFQEKYKITILSCLSLFPESNKPVLLLYPPLFVEREKMNATLGNIEETYQAKSYNRDFSPFR